MLSSKRVLLLSNMFVLCLASLTLAGDKIEVKVFDQAGRPIAGAKVRASWQGITHFTDRRGEVKIKDTPKRRVSIVVDKAGYQPQTVVHDFNKKRRDVDVTLTRAVSIGYPTFPPPRPPVEARSQRAGQQWIAGQYAWNSRTGQYQWTAGRYVAKKRGLVWVAGTWKQQGNRYVLVPGHWERPRTQTRTSPRAGTRSGPGSSSGSAENKYPRGLSVPAVTISPTTGLPVYAIPLRGGDSRASDNFAKIVGFDYQVRARLINVRASDARDVRMVVRGDRKNSGDKNRSKVFRDGETFWIDGAGATKQRGNFIGRIEFPAGTNAFNQLNPDAILELTVVRKGRR